MTPNVKPMPAELSETARKVAAWAAQQKLINRVYVFGGMFKGTPNPKDLDLAVEYIFDDEGDVNGAFIFDCRPWTRKLSAITGLKVDLDVAHPEVAPTVWSYLSEGCGLFYERPA